MECSYTSLDKSINYNTLRKYLYFTIFMIYYDGVGNEERIFYTRISSVFGDF